jgi:hypothetical protein
MKSKMDGGKRAGGRPPRNSNGDDLRRALDWIVGDAIFAEVRVHGNVKWSPLALVRLAIFWVWSQEPGLVQAAKDAVALVAKLFGNSAVAVRSYQALTAALVGYTSQLLPRLWARLQSLMQESGQSYWRIGKWLALAVDGSRVSVPRTARNEERFGSTNPRSPNARSGPAGRNALGTPIGSGRISFRRAITIHKQSVHKGG